MLITEDYRKQQEQMHAEIPGYGVTGRLFGRLVSEIMTRLNITELLDYGCGHNLSLFKAIKTTHKFRYQAYDPGVQEYAKDPIPSQMVACIDVLEHIEPDLIDNVLDDLAKLTEQVGLFTVHTGPAGKTLPDGRNAHLIQESPEWWLAKLLPRFDLQTFQRIESGFYVIVYPGEPDGLIDIC
jgi:hypothetical protein